MSTNHAGRQLFAAIKQTTRAGHSPVVLTIGRPLLATLRPIATIPGNLDALDVKLLTDWRNQHVKSFLSEFVANERQTEQWLGQSVHQNDGKMLFMVETLQGERVGHVGLGFIDWSMAYGEADAIVSGGKSPKGLMKESLLTLMRWSRDVLGLRALAVRVRSDNSAVAFYQKVGFEEFKRVPIVPMTVSGGVTWVEDPMAVNCVATLVHMNLNLKE
ncbi:MAG: GNAT family N-acetyltransferase [Moraxellaceae bacterium]|nr:GNAT family N-acetyltransferase [Moraxellaceae bacterium]